MNDVAGIPYLEARFDPHGTLEKPVALALGVTDLLIVSHGWNNNEEEARNLYRELFQNFVAVGTPGDLPARTFAIVGVIWPSKKFDELVAVAGEAHGAGGAAGLGAGDRPSLKALEDKLDRMKQTFAGPGQAQTLDAVKGLLPDLEDKASARREFVETIRSLLDRTAANREDASDSFFKDDGNELMKNLKVDEADLDEEVAAPGGSAALGAGGNNTAADDGGAAGLKELLSGFSAAAMNVLNFTTYFEMKARAGQVGHTGVATLIDALAPNVERIHLIGHSFGGRVVTAAAAGSTTVKIASMSLLQTAFSHNGFSRTKGGFFRSVVDSRRVNGPILVTHTKNDRAVGVAYPLASRINGDKAAAFGDENDVFGGLGRNGAQQMQPGETVVGRLLTSGSPYAFEAGKFFNLEASDFIKHHSDVTSREVAHAIRKAMAVSS